VRYLCYNKGMDTLKNEIRDLLQHNLFVSEEKKHTVLEKLEAETDKEKIKHLHKMLIQADATQRTLVKKTIQKNPHFLSDVKRMGSQQKRKRIIEIEATERTKDQSALSDLETELSNLFS